MEIYRAALDGELRECFSGREGFLYDLLRYHLGWVDQQGQPENGVSQGGLGGSFHALAAPAVGEALTGEFEAALPVAAGVELLHNFTLVHGDVQAGRVEAGARPSIWWVWGPAQAINAGDGFHALARVAVMRLLDLGIAAERALAAAEMLDRTCLAMCEGQFADLGFQDKLLVTTAEYDAMIANKAGALTGYAAAGGALAAGADEAGQARFRELGVKLGMAWQMTRDVGDFWGREGDGVTASNVLNKKKSLPLIYTLENCSTAAKREIGAAYMKRVLEPADIGRVVEIMEEAGARAHAEERAAGLVREAMAIAELEGVGEEGMSGLRALGELAVAV